MLMSEFAIGFGIKNFYHEILLRENYFGALNEYAKFGGNSSAGFFNHWKN